MNKETLNKINNVITLEKQTRLQYNSAIDDLVGEKIEYYGMNVLVDQVAKYVKYEHFYKGIKIDEETSKNIKQTEISKHVKTPKGGDIIFPEFKAIYIIKLLDKKDINDENEGYMFMDTSSLTHSMELLTN